MAATTEESKTTPGKKSSLEPKNKTFSQRVATKVANSFLLRSGKALHEQHLNDFQLGGSYLNKALANLYLIINDYGEGLFPPKLGSREETFESEREQHVDYQSDNYDDIVAYGLGKPATHPLSLAKMYFWIFGQISEALESRGIAPGARILELGCGQGWLSELLATRGYDVTGCTIAPIHIETAKLRIESLKVKKLNCKLNFFVSPMEDVDRHVDLARPYDAVFCFEALHHVYDWRESIRSMTKCVRPGGYLMICNEPPGLHTYLAYRSSKILKTHEIGFNVREVFKYVKELGYTDIELSRPVYVDRPSQFWRKFLPVSFGDGAVGARAFWIIARKK